MDRSPPRSRRRLGTSRSPRDHGRSSRSYSPRRVCSWSRRHSSHGVGEREGGGAAPVLARSSSEGAQAHGRFGNKTKAGVVCTYEKCHSAMSTANFKRHFSSVHLRPGEEFTQRCRDEYERAQDDPRLFEDEHYPPHLVVTRCFSQEEAKIIQVERVTMHTNGCVKELTDKLQPRSDGAILQRLERVEYAVDHVKDDVHEQASLVHRAEDRVVQVEEKVGRLLAAQTHSDEQRECIERVVHRNERSSARAEDRLERAVQTAEQRMRRVESVVTSMEQAEGQRTQCVENVLASMRRIENVVSSMQRAIARVDDGLSAVHARLESFRSPSAFGRRANEVVNLTGD